VVKKSAPSFTQNDYALITKMEGNQLKVIGKRQNGKVTLFDPPRITGQRKKILDRLAQGPVRKFDKQR
jgi:hypothetical protein